MYCRICGTERNVEFRISHSWNMCDHCHGNSDKHVLSYGEFNDEYWMRMMMFPSAREMSSTAITGRQAWHMRIT